ncbi:hypothetical protein ScPMuIL_003292 [Solemya velum]
MNLSSLNFVWESFELKMDNNGSSFETKMGANSSSFSELANNEYLRKLSGTDPIDQMDPYWNQLLSYSFLIPINSADSKLLEEATSAISKNFAINNCRTGNFGALTKNFLLRATELKASAQCEDNIFTWQTYNALFIIRTMCKYFVEHLSEELLIQQFDTKSPAESSSEKVSLAEEFINSLVELLVDVPVMNFTYALHLEALNTLLVLLSIQMFQPQPARKFILYRYMMQGKWKSSIVLRLWMGLMIIAFCLSASLWSVVTLGMTHKAKKPEEEFSETLLANQSLLFLLVLANHCTTERLLPNPYRQAMFSFTNSQNNSPTKVAATFKIDYSQLYNTLSNTLRDDQTTLLLYLLIHQNEGMKAFILSRTNIDQLVMPLLKILYGAQDRNSHHIYMALIILLILSEDDVFNKAIHDIVLKNIPWFQERALAEVTLGGLIILVVIRTIQYNMTRMRDKYLHTNCLAALANMSGNFNNLHPYVSQRLISLFSQLCKKHTRLIELIRQAAVSPQHSEEHSEEETEQDHVQDLAVLEEVIRMVLEILNSCLCNCLHHNPNLLYSILYEKDLFSQFRTHPTFQDIIQNIDSILNYFSTRLEQNGASLSPSEVLDIIKVGAIQFKREQLKKFPELKFKYVEEESPEEFFIPYIWSLVYHSCNMYFNTARIVLFSLTSS